MKPRLNNCDRKKFAEFLKELTDGNGESIQKRIMNLRVEELADFTFFGIGVVLAMDKAGLANNAEDACEFMNALAEIVNGGTCKNKAMKDSDEFLCSECGEHIDIVYVNSCNDYHYHARYCPHCGREVNNLNDN